MYLCLHYRHTPVNPSHRLRWQIQRSFYNSQMSSGLQRLLRSYEDQDCIAFDPVVYKPATAPPRGPMRRSSKATSEDEDLVALRKEVSDLEAEQRDLDQQVKHLRECINDLQRQLGQSVDPPPSPKSKPVRSPLLPKRRIVTPRTNGESSNDYYRRNYFAVQKKLEGLKDALTKGKKMPV